MTTVLDIIGSIFVALFFIIFFACIIFSIHCFVWFHLRTCKHCQHTLEFKGSREIDGVDCFCFYYPKCGKWEQIPKAEFFRDIDKGLDPTKMSI